jgi:transposase
MATEKVTIRMQAQILELHREGRTARAIARIVGKNRRTVARVIKRGSVTSPGVQVPEWSKSVDWEMVRLKVSQGVQFNILAREYAEGVIGYVQFWREYRKQNPSHPTVTMKLVHKPGEKSFFDYAEGINIVDRGTGEVTKTWLMCGVMAMSSMSFGEFTLSQKRDELMRSMENAFRYFGGVTPYVTVDNQRAAVDRADWYDPDVNPAFIDFANHWGFAVIPARPYRPRDKGANESAIGVMQRQFYQQVREKTFFSLAELNGAFSDYLKVLNQSKMKDWGVSRLDRFEGERELLKPCPVSNWQPSEWKTPKVHPDCHVQVLKKFYSVPFINVGREVRVRVTAKLVEIFDGELNPLAVHVRLLGKEIYSTNELHYPEEKLALAQFSVEVAKRDAALVGPETERLVNVLLDTAHPLRYLRRAQGILRLLKSNRVTKEGLEHGSKMAMTFNKTQHGYVQSAAEYFDRNGSRPKLVPAAPVREVGTMFLHNKLRMENGNDE